MVWWVHLLRAVAALGVTIGHAHSFALSSGFGDYVPDFPIGAAGVDLFFVISGFVMVIASVELFGKRGAPQYFFTRRLVRIVPIYWLANGIFLVFMIVGKPHAAPDISVSNIVTSLLFIPDRLLSGAVVPIYGLGWTLNFEMAFYVAFSAVLFLWPRLAIPALSIAMLGLAYVAPRYPLPLPINYWANPIIIEFVFGMIIGLARVEGFRLPNWMSVLLVAAGFVWFAISAATFWIAFGREFCWGLPAAAMVAGAGLCQTDLLSRRWPARLAILIGDSSYALYLFHPLAMLLPYVLLHRILPPASVPYLYAAMLFISCAGAAIVIHLLIERPTTNWLQRRINNFAFKRNPLLKRNAAA